MTLNSSGAVDSYNNYYPFGEQLPGMNGTGSSDGRYKYISTELDAETSSYDMGARYYDPWSGRFLSVDPMASDSTLASWSPYQYSFDNPVRFKDPTGKWPDWATLGIEVGSWIQNEFSGAQNSIVNSMGYQNTSTEQLQAEAHQQSQSLMVPTSKQMSALGFHAVSNFVYAEGAGSAAGLGGTLAAVGLSQLGAAGLLVTAGNAYLKLSNDYASGSGYSNVLVPLTLGTVSYATGVPLGAEYSGARYGLAIYRHFVPPPLSLCGE